MARLFVVACVRRRANQTLVQVVRHFVMYFAQKQKKQKNVAGGGGYVTNLPIEEFIGT